MPRVTGLAVGAGVLLLLGIAGFMVWKARAVARELVDPPFYRPQPLARVAATYDDLARGDGADPGGDWTHQQLGELTLWHLKRARPAPAIVLLLHGFGDDRWGTSPALRWFPGLDAAIFTYRARDEALRAGRTAPAVTFGAREREEVVAVVHHLEAQGWPRRRILLMGRSLGASVGLLALARLEAEGRGPLGGIVWEGAPASSRDFAERLVRGPRDRAWHLLAPGIGALAARWASGLGNYRMEDTDLLRQMPAALETPALAFIATQDRLAPCVTQQAAARRFRRIHIVEVPTWHLNCAPVLGRAYADAIQNATAAWTSK